MQSFRQSVPKHFAPSVKIYRPRHDSSVRFMD